MTKPTLQDFRLLHQDCGRPGVDVSSLLGRARVFAEVLKDQQTLGWISHELTGYAMERDVPDYRVLPASLVIPTGGEWRSAQWISSGLRHQHSRIAIPSSVEQLQNVVADPANVTMSIPIDASQFKKYLHDTVDLRQSRMEIAKENVAGMLLAIRIRLREWMDLIDKDAAGAFKETERVKEHGVSSANPRVFIVHGHDTQAVNQVENVLIKLGYTPISLQEHPSGSETIIQRLDRESDVVFAIILLTPDDHGGPRGGSEKLKVRARQNVIFEYGYFIQKLSPGRVFPLKRGDIELPSNLGGTTPYDFDKEWQRPLVSTMKKAGLDADFNLLL